MIEDTVLRASISRAVLPLLPKFFRTEYSPYKCGVSANREDYDLRARRVHLQNMVKTWFNTGRNPFRNPVQCSFCLFDTRIPNIYIHDDGLCNMCHTYRRNFNRDILNEELTAFLDTPRLDGARYDAAVAFSGGKDSTASLYLARTKLNLQVIAVLVDNGFIPQEVIDNGRGVCDRLGVELHIIRIDFAPQLKAMAAQDFRFAYPCYKCTEMFHTAIQQYCASHRINRIVLGRNWWRWLEPQVRAIRRVVDLETSMELQLLSLPFALQMTERSTMAVLSEIDWKPVSIHGNSTNCLVPGLVEYRMYKRLGYHPELNLLSREVISGYLDKDSATKKLAVIRDLTPLLTSMLSNSGTTRQTTVG